MSDCDHLWMPVYTMFWWRAVCLHCDERHKLERRWPFQYQTTAEGQEQIKRHLG